MTLRKGRQIRAIPKFDDIKGGEELKSSIFLFGETFCPLIMPEIYIHEGSSKEAADGSNKHR